MTHFDAAYTILKAAGQPLHFEEITQRALAQKLITPEGLTPEATVGSRPAFAQQGTELRPTQWRPRRRQKFLASSLLTKS